MFYIYVLKSKVDGSTYVGFSNDLKRRLKEHNAQKNKSTRNEAPYELIYYESYKSESDAKHRERSLKRFAQAHRALKSRIKNSLD